MVASSIGWVIALDHREPFTVAHFIRLYVVCAVANKQHKATQQMRNIQRRTTTTTKNYGIATERKSTTMTYKNQYRSQIDNFFFLLFLYQQPYFVGPTDQRQLLPSTHTRIKSPNINLQSCPNRSYASAFIWRSDALFLVKLCVRIWTLQELLHFGRNTRSIVFHQCTNDIEFSGIGSTNASFVYYYEKNTKLIEMRIMGDEDDNRTPYKTNAGVPKNCVFKNKI